MAFRDDDEELSDSHRFERADPKKDAKERAAASKGKLLQFQRQLLRQQTQGVPAVNDGEEKEEADARMSDEAMQQKDDAGSFGTKTMQEEAKEAVRTATQKQTEESLLQDAKRAEAVEEASSEEYQRDQTA